MTDRPAILVAPHVRELDTPLGRLRGAIVYDRYLDRVVAAGGEPLIGWVGSADPEGLVERAEGVLLVGGGDVRPSAFGSDEEGDGIDEERDDFERRLVLAARETGTPLLGMCRGCQVLNVALGGTLDRLEGHRQQEDLSTPSHAVDVSSGSRLAAALGTTHVEANSFHRWVPGSLGEGLTTSARSPSGHVEGIETADGWWAVGLQWHAELLDDDASRRLFDALVASARGRRTP